MKVLCISAKARHGKDTAAELIKDCLEAADKKVLIIHYADLLKFICTKFFDWDGNKDEKGRTLLQYIGTDVVGAKRPDYWVDFVIDFLKLFEDEWDFVLIPDCRYPIEVTKMKANFYTKLLRLERPNFVSDLTPEQLQHPSETSMDNYPFDALIYNNKDLKTLKEKLVQFTHSFLLD